MTAADRLEKRIRTICLALPETSEVETWGHPSFRAGKKTFAALEVVDGRASLAVRVDPLEAGVFSADERFFPTPYGRGQWISLWLDARAEAPLVRALIERAWRLVANKRMLTSQAGKSTRSPRRTRP